LIADNATGLITQKVIVSTVTQPIDVGGVGTGTGTKAEIVVVPYDKATITTKAPKVINVFFIFPDINPFSPKTTTDIKTNAKIT